MKTIATILGLCLAAGAVHAQCQPIGWIKVGDRQLSITERQCIYEKNGARVAIIVSGLCPFHPC